jgi:cell division protein FtsN
MADEGFHEIELKGKQLVFLFMAATVVSVVIFLCGVMVGRGVRTPDAAVSPERAQDVTVDPTAVVQAAPTPAPAPEGAPVSTKEALTYDQRLEADSPIAETLRPAVEPASNVPEPPSEPLPAREPRTTAATPVEKPRAAAEPQVAEPAGNGYVVQVMAARTRAEADRIARGLGSKGFPAFVTMAGGATPTPYRVRVGKYNNLREAESMAQRLKKEEQFNTWITR